MTTDENTKFFKIQIALEKLMKDPKNQKNQILKDFEWVVGKLHACMVEEEKKKGV